MVTISDRLNALGRLFFRALGSLCALAALGCLTGIVWVARNWDGGDSAIGMTLFLVGGGLATWCAAHCFSSRRTLIEALDAMEGVPLDPRPGEDKPLS